MKSAFLKLFIFSTFIYSCSSNSNCIHLLYTDVSGLTKGVEVSINGKQVGYVSEIHFVEYNKLIVNLQMDNNISIPRGSKFAIETKDILGNRIIAVELSDSTEYYTCNDTITGSRPKSIRSVIDSVITKIRTDTTYSPLIKEVKDVFRVADSLGIIGAEQH